ERTEKIPVNVAVAILCGILHGLHAAHEATSERGRPLGLVHRDVSPQNILVGADGVPRLFDFGIAKAAGRLQHTRDGVVKGKLGYMAPEQLRGAVMNRRSDIYAASVVLWELLTNRRLLELRSGREQVRSATASCQLESTSGLGSRTPSADSIRTAPIELEIP